MSGQKGSVENTFVFLSKLVHCVHIAVVQWLCTEYARAMLRRGGGRSKNPDGGGRSNVVGIICPPVAIGLTDLPKGGGGEGIAL